MNIVGILLIYILLLVLILGYRKPAIDRDEFKTAIVAGILWAVSVFGGNYLFFKIGIMSYLPWVNNFLHTFIWIGSILTFLYFAIRGKFPLWQQMIYFAIFSLIVKFAESMIFGIWEHEHFFWIFKGNLAYIIGWSLMDGLYPVITKMGIRILGRFISGISVI